MNSEPFLNPEVVRDDSAALVKSAPGSHAISTGVGVASGGATGAAIGLTVGGPVGAVIGAVIGAVAGGMGGNALYPSAATERESETQVSTAFEYLASPSHDAISSRAWTYFEQRRKTEGHDLDDWLRAERDLAEEPQTLPGNGTEI